MANMRLSARADYALRAAIELAAAHDGHVTAEQLAQAQNIPGKFLETILTHLRRSNIVRSQRGPDGGFWLARPASEISLADIIRAIDGLLTGSGAGQAFKASGGAAMDGLNARKLDRDVAGLIDSVVVDLMKDKVIPQMLKMKP